MITINCSANQRYVDLPNGAKGLVVRTPLFRGEQPDTHKSVNIEELKILSMVGGVVFENRASRVQFDGRWLQPEEEYNIDSRNILPVFKHLAPETFRRDYELLKEAGVAA